MAFVQGDKGSTGGATTVATAGITTTSGNALVVVVATNSVNVTSVTDNKGNTFTPASSNPQNTTGSREYAFVAQNISGGAGHVITANLASSAIAAIATAEFSGRATSSVVASQTAFVESTRTASHVSGSSGALPVTGCDMVCAIADSAFIDQGTTEVYTGTSGWTVPASAAVATAGATVTAYIAYLENVGTGSQQATWTNSAGTITAASVLYALAPPASGGKGDALPLLGVG